MSDFIPVCKTTDLPDPGKRTFDLERQSVILIRQGGHFYALDDCCTHDGGPLRDGLVEGFEITCPRHGSTFDIRTGEALRLPATRPTLAHRVRLEGDQVLIQCRERPATRRPAVL